MKRSVVIFLMLAGAGLAKAQPPDSLWSRTFGGNLSDNCNSVQQTSDGGYILGGETGSFGTGNEDMYLVKTDANGDSLWSRTFGGSSEDRCYSVQQSSDGGYILGGETGSFGTGNGDMYLVKTDANGDSLWSRTFGGSLSEFCYSVQQTSDDGYILGGFTISFGAGSWNMYLVKTDGNGDSLWSRTFGGDNYDWCKSVQQTSDGGYILGGTTDSFGAGLYDMFLVKTDPNGNSQWSRTFGGSSTDLGNSVQQTSDGGYILGGTTDSFGAGLYDMYLVKTDANGDSLWSRTFGGSSPDGCLSVQQTSDGGYILGGPTISYSTGDFDMWLVKTGQELQGTTENSSVQEYALRSIYPNPFNAVASVAFDLPKDWRVTLRVFDVMGREVGVIADRVFTAGEHQVSWRCRDCASGVYLLRMETEAYQTTQRIVLMK